MARSLSATALVAIIPFITPAVAAEFPLERGQAAVGAVDTYKTKASDNLLDLARQYDIGYVDFMAANPGVDPWQPGNQQQIAIPARYILPDAPRVGIVINLASRLVFYYPPGGKTVEVYPAGIGVEADATPVGLTSVVRKEAGPTWVPPPSIRAERPDLPLSIPPGPDDPLGDYALRLGWNNILIHGTNKPDSVGRNVSHGCFHIYPEDIERIFREIPVGTKVRTILQPVEAAWVAGRLYVQVYPSKEQADQIDYNHAMTPAVPAELMARVAAVAGDRVDAVDWDAVGRAGEAATGIPTPVTESAIAALEE